MSKLYIACALTHVPRDLFFEYSSIIHDIAKKLKKEGHEVHYALVDSDPQLADKKKKADLCYQWDRDLVLASDIIIAEVSFPSLGLGIELQISENNSIPIIMIHKDFLVNHSKPISYVNPDDKEHELQIGNGKISLMALGLPNIHSVYYYNDVDKVLPKIIRDILNVGEN